MASNSAIEWTDATWSVTTGCTRVSEGCRFCYAEVMSKRLGAMAKQDIAEGRNPGKKRYYLNVIDHNGRWNSTVNLVEEALSIPLAWKKPRRVFVNSMSDLFHEAVPFEFIDRVFSVMGFCSQHTFQVLTKRPERMAEYLAYRDGKPAHVEALAAGLSVAMAQLVDQVSGHPWPLPNVWLGTSVENQAAAEERIPHLLRCTAAVRFLSVEPLLAPVDLRGALHLTWTYSAGRTDVVPPPGIQGGWWSDLGTMAHDSPKIDWVIVGGESGPGARPFNIEWARSIISQCKTAGVAVFCKQLGAVPIIRRPIAGSGPACIRESAAIDAEWPENTFFGNRTGDPLLNGMQVLLRDSKGGDWSEWPADLRVRQFPAACEVPA